MLLLLIVAGLGYAMVRYDESPQQIWKRLASFVESFTKPASTPAPTPAPEPTATPTPEPKPTPAPTPEPAPVDPLTWLRENKHRWPKEVTLLAPTEFPVVIAGK